MAGGRPSKLDENVLERLVTAIEAGNTYKAACAYAGIHYATFARWMKRGLTANSGEYREFCDAVKEAEARAEVALVGYINQAGREGKWQAHAWLLERRNPNEWARREYVQPDDEGTTKVVFEDVEIEDDDEVDDDE